MEPNPTEESVRRVRTRPAARWTAAGHRLTRSRRTEARAVAAIEDLQPVKVKVGEAPPNRRRAPIGRSLVARTVPGLPARRTPRESL